MQDEPEGIGLEKTTLGDSDQESHTWRHDTQYERHTNTDH